MLSTFIGRLRTDLQDAGGEIWTDGELTEHLGHATRDFSRARPRERQSALATQAGNRTIDVSSLTDLIAVVAVEWPVGEYPRVYQRFSFYAGTLEMIGPDVPGGVEAVNIFWLGPHTLDAETSTIPAHWEDIVLIGAGAYALLDQAARTINAVNTGGSEARAAYRELGETRLRHFRELLRQHGRGATVRARRFYTPARPAAGQTREVGP